MLKKDLRKKYIEMRKALLPEQINELSEQIVEQFLSLPLGNVKFLHTFYPIVGKHEFNSLLLVERVKTMYPDMVLVLPRSDLKDHSLKHIIWTPDTSLTMNEWGITEPEGGEDVEPDLIDLVVIPLLAFDKRGHRLGYGKGFYDRFLYQCRPDVVKTGISFFEPEEQIESELHDIPLDKCITPGKIWEFNAGDQTASHLKGFNH